MSGGVTSVGAVGSWYQTSGETPLVDPTTGKTLLPPPSLGDDQLDTMALLYLMQTKLREQGMKDAKTSVEVKHADIKEALRKEHEALQKAVEQAKKGGFWDSVESAMITVAKVAAVAASVALAVGTGGVGVVGALAIAGAVMSSAGFTQGEFHVLEKLGVDSDTASWIGTGLLIGGAASSLGAGLLSAGSAGTTGVRVASVVGGTAAVAGGVAKIEAGDAHANELHSMADALHEQMKAQWLQQRLLSMIDALKDSDESDARVLDGIRGAMMTKGDTLVASSMRA